MHPVMAGIDWAARGDEAVELLRSLLRFDTTNPPGDELACAEYLAELFRGAGLEPKVLCSEGKRANVITRVRGNGSKPPILLNAHLDVVPAERSRWSQDPFAADIHEGYIYGRGAVDMKNMAAMSAMVLKLLAESGVPLDRDVIFAGVADEETGCDKGSSWLVDHHPDEVRAEYGLGEIGAFSMYMNGRTIYPIQVAEKGRCWVRASVEGQPGHASIPRDDNAVVTLAERVARLGRTRLPMHVAPILRRAIDAMARSQPLPARAVLPLVLNERFSSLVTDRLIPDASVGRVFSALVRNTATPTVLRAGSKTNVIPSTAVAEIDGRIAVGSTEAQFLDELRALVGPGVQLDVITSAPPYETTPDTPLFETLAQVVIEHDPGAHVVPYCIPGFTDAQSWGKLGTKCYGFSPVKFDPTHDIKFADLYHGDDERIPVGGFKFGLRMLADAVLRFCAT
jgi:acetylornithine deacetylase/succinyl-diaminopimelate desuccinylase-like protein